MSNHLFICQNAACGKDFEAKRSDAKFCSPACKMAHHRAEKKQQEKIAEAKRKREAPLLEEQQALREKIQALNGIIKAINSGIDPWKTPKPVPQPKPKNSPEIIALENQIAELKRLLDLSDIQLYNLTLNPRIMRLRNYVKEGKSFVLSFFSEKNSPEVHRYIRNNWIGNFAPDQEFAVEDALRSKREELFAHLTRLREQHSEMIAAASLSGMEKTKVPADQPPWKKQKFRYLQLMTKTNMLRSLIDAKKKLQKIEEALRNPPEQEKPEARPPQPKPRKRTVRKKGKGLSPEDLRNMDFDTLDLSGEGELGYFLGDLETNMLAFALIGDQSAGKSTFSYRLAKLFMNIGKRVKYFSLEEGTGRLAHEKLNKVGIENNDPFEIVGEGRLPEVRKEASEWDVVIIDSWSVLDEKPEQYNKLRTDFPNTIFIVIFQKTNADTIRGGRRIIYDTPACINVYRKGKIRYAEMRKSRYGTQDWVYSITEDEVVSYGNEGQ